MPTAIVRLLGANGRYPRFDLAHKHHRLVVSQDVCWMASLLSPTAPVQSEVSVYHAEEIPLYAAVLLAEPNPWQNGYLWLHPLHGHWVELPAGADLLTPASVSLLRGEVERQRNAHKDLAAVEYDFGNIGTPECCITIIDSVDLADQVLLRGLSKLQIARHLSQIDFLEEAGIAAMISLEAALTLIRLRLTKAIGHEASFEEAFAHVEAAFPLGSSLRQFFQEVYDLRIITIHPKSRFGDFWTPPMDVDDVYGLFQELVGLWRYLILDEVPVADTL